MPQEAKLEAYRKAFAAQRFISEGAGDEDEDTYSPNWFTGAATTGGGIASPAAMSGVERRIYNAIRRVKARSQPNLLLVLKTHSALYLDSLANLYELMPAEHFAIGPATTTNEDLSTTLWLGANNAGIFNDFDLAWDASSEIDYALVISCRSLTWRYADQLLSRLKDLLDCAREESPDGPGLSKESLASFCDFVRTVSFLILPELALTPDGNIYARWKVDRRRLFSTQFLPNGDVRFVVFKPNEMHEDRVVRLSGLTTADALMQEIKSQGAAEWMLDPHEG